MFYSFKEKHCDGYIMGYTTNGMRSICGNMDNSQEHVLDIKKQNKLQNITYYSMISL